MKKEMLESFAKNQNSHVFQKNKPGETKASASNMASPTDGKEIDPKLAPQAVS
jgi:hypothetical protein